MLEIRGLTRDYGEQRGVFNLSLTVEEGQSFGFLGSNGAGKTTTIQHIMGFLKPQKGECRLFGLDCWKDREKIQASVGYVPGEVTFFGEMTAEEYFNFLRHYRGDVNKREAELTAYFNLDAKQKIHKMSKGNKQKVALISALMHDPKIYIFDEPTAGLDPFMQARFVQLMKDEQGRGKTLFMSSHIFEEVEKICDTVGIINQGQLLIEDSMAHLRDKHVRTYEVVLESDEEAQAFAEDFNGELDGKCVKVSKTENLEDMFMKYYGG